MTTHSERPPIGLALHTALKNRVDALYLEYIFPVLAVLRVGEDPAAVEWESELLAAAKAVGVRVRRYILPADVPASDVELLIREINADFLLSALLLIAPMPEPLDPAAFEQYVLPEKRIAAPLSTEENAALLVMSCVIDAAERKAK